MTASSHTLARQQWGQTPWGLSPLLLLMATLAHAGLGGQADSIEADRVAMKATTLRQVSAAQYTVHEITTPAGVQVREYLAPNGVVFAVAWNGPRIPDLKQLLGSYFGTFKTAASAPHGRGPLHIERPDLVVHSGGHMRAFVGQAYAPLLLPPGVSVADLR